MNDAYFDKCAQDYEAQLNRGLVISGENRDFFAKGRILWLSRCLERLAFAPKSVLDYGCGTGSATRFFVDILGAEQVVGVDLSAKSLEIARQIQSGLPAEYWLPSDYNPSERIDLAFCNGVFHHIVPSDRLDAVRYVAGCLRPGGLFALWENNPWNPGTRYIMSRVPFDRDAVLLRPKEVRLLVQNAGLEVLRTDYCFIFPRLLRAFRGLEPYLSGMPFGAQFQVLGCKHP